MTWLAPWFLAGGVLAALAVVGAHLLARHRPPRESLPTARFVPASRPVSATRLSPPSDRALLALRVLACLLIGAAFARPLLLPARGSLARVVLLDRSNAVRDPAAAAALARAELRAGDLLIAFDSAATEPLALDEAERALASPISSEVAGSLSAGLAAGMRAGASLRVHADSVELVLLSPVVAMEGDAATRALREGWPGRIRVIPLPARADSQAAQRVELRAGADDPLRATAALAGLLAEGAGAERRLVREAADASDSAWVRAGTGRVLLEWPADSVSPAGWRPRSALDTIGGAVTRGAVVVANFARRLDPPAGRVVARWSDGEALATESKIDGGCVRHVALPVPSSGDLALRPSMRRLLVALLHGCARPGEDLISPAGHDEEITWLDAAGPAASARALARLDRDAAGDSRLAPWLLALGAALLVLELVVRDRARRVAR